MCGKENLDDVFFMSPFRMMVHGISDVCDVVHECKCISEISKFKFPLDVRLLSIKDTLNSQKEKGQKMYRFYSFTLCQSVKDCDCNKPLTSSSENFWGFICLTSAKALIFGTVEKNLVTLDIIGIGTNVLNKNLIN